MKVVTAADQVLERGALADLLGREVDVVDSAALRQTRERVPQEAIPL